MLSHITRVKSILNFKFEVKTSKVKVIVTKNKAKFQNKDRICAENGSGCIILVLDYNCTVTWIRGQLYSFERVFPNLLDVHGNICHWSLKYTYK